MRELKMLVHEDINGKIISMMPVKPATDRPGNTVTLVCRVYTQDEIDRETSELMQEGTHTYYKKHGVTHQKS
jgi:hypothetical protein